MALEEEPVLIPDFLFSLADATDGEDLGKGTVHETPCAEKPSPTRSTWLDSSMNKRENSIMFVIIRFLSLWPSLPELIQYVHQIHLTPHKGVTDLLHLFKNMYKQ